MLASVAVDDWGSEGGVYADVRGHLASRHMVSRALLSVAPRFRAIASSCASCLLCVLRSLAVPQVALAFACVPSSSRPPAGVSYPVGALWRLSRLDPSPRSTQRGRGMCSVVNGFLQYTSLLVHLLVRVCFPGIDIVDIVRKQVTLQSRDTASVYMQLLQDTIILCLLLFF